MIIDKQNILRMKYLILSILIAVMACSPATNPTASTLDKKAETEILKKLEYDALVAEFKLDTASIASILHERFQYIGVQNVTNKQEELEGIYKNISQRLKEGHTVDSFYLDQFKAEIFDNTAIVSFFTVTKGMMKATPYENKRTRFYDVWVRENGQWKLAAMQATSVIGN